MKKYESIKVLIVCSGNYPEHIANFSIYRSFIADQVEALRKYYNIKFDIFFIVGKGMAGYFSNIPKLRKYIKSKEFSLVHAHYCLSGIASLIASPVPVVVTFHGSDINLLILNMISSSFIRFLRETIIVEKKLYDKLLIKPKNKNIIPCGVDFELFYPESMELCKKIEGLSIQKDYLLFSSRFDNRVKNYSLCQEAVRKANINVEILELKDKTREQVRHLLNASKALILTSFTEGSPQIIKEAMACNCPIVATNVGDIFEIIKNTEGCYIAKFNVQDVAEKINMVLAFGRRTNGREKIANYDNKLISARIKKVYHNAMK